MITFCRVSGPVVHELVQPSDAEIARSAADDRLVVSIGVGSRASLAWVVEPGDAIPSVAGWRLSLVHTGARAVLLDALVRSGARYLRSDRPSEAVAITSLPGVEAEVSTHVSSLSEAVAAVQEGATDLLLREWDDEAIGLLRETLGVPLIERPGIPIDVPAESVRRELSGETLTAYLHVVDALGAVRPRTDWAPGKDLPIPAPPSRLSAQWSDTVWLSGACTDPVDVATAPIRRILDRSMGGARPNRDELATLFRARGDDVDAIAWVADRLRADSVGDVVTYVVNRNINYTNLCTYKCRFCAFSKGPKSLNLRGEPYLMSIDDVVDMAAVAWTRGATEVCLQGGIHPGFTGDFYVELVERIKAQLPGIHVHGFTPLEVWQGAETLGVSVRGYLERLRDAGLGSLPGTAAEILDDRVRADLCPDKITTAEWADVMITAHEIGLRSTATVMFGHIDDAEAWANHLEVLRAVQHRTGGFTEFVPLPFVHMGAPIYLQGKSRKGPTWDEVVLMHAVARLAFDGLIHNIQASWVKLGTDGAGRLLTAGCNDLGGTLMGEIITRSAGASHGQEVSVEQFESVIRATGRTPRQRTTLYADAPVVDRVTPL
jgi:FO synthase